ncbi:MAG: lipid-A-disaccharide synthase [Thermoanaerobaculia bacterium]|nr:lipid-A-disaccharide synthase [Thermoanaerobaculia bacterium]
MGKADLLLVAGEASGDQHGARLLAALQRLRGGDLQPFGLGGDELIGAGLDSVAHSSEVAVMGISEALKVLPRARAIYRLLLAEVERRRPEVAVLVDFAEFNMRLARDLSRRGVKVVYYVSPQVWAWRRGRVRTVADTVERMLVLLPFEVDFYRRHGVEVVHVGHPLVDEVPLLPQRWDREEEPRPPYVVSLLPGSRPSEVSRLLPILLGAAKVLAREEAVELRLIRAPGLPVADLERHLGSFPAPVEIVSADRYREVADSHVALCASGTAALETALLGTPTVVVYRVAWLSYLTGLLLVRLPFVSLVNLVLGRQAVAEMLQGDATPEKVARQALRLLRRPDRVRRMRTDFEELRRALGAPGASERAAREVHEVLEG